MLLSPGMVVNISITTEPRGQEIAATKCIYMYNITISTTKLHYVWFRSIKQMQNRG